MGGDEATAGVEAARPVHCGGRGCAGDSGAAVNEGYRAISLDLAYDGQPVRVVGTPERPLFVGVDACTPLGLKNHRSSLALVPDEEKGVHSVDTPGGPQQMVCLTEGGLYRLISFSRKPEAERFKSWIFNEVLPSLRQHGQYPPPGALTVRERQEQRALVRSEVESAILLATQSRFDRVDSRLEEIARHLERIPPTRKEIPQSTKTPQLQCVHHRYFGNCTCCLVVPILDGRGTPLPSLRWDHWASRGKVSIQDVWPVCESCNYELGEPGSLSRRPHEHCFAFFQKRIGIDRPSGVPRGDDPRQSKLF